MPFVFHQPIWVLFRCHFQDLYTSFISYYKKSITDYRGILKHDFFFFFNFGTAHMHTTSFIENHRKKNAMPMNPKRTQITINASHHKSLCSWISHIDSFSLDSTGRSSSNILFNSVETLVHYILCILWNPLIVFYIQHSCARISAA